ncbi:MAG: hypothetical protein IJ272_00030 [Clostridia bacterium]|nr:hypothetical protein [Clostridia bacterium]
MKKRLAIFLSLIMVLSLMGCKGNGVKNAAKNFSDDFLIDITLDVECEELVDTTDLSGKGDTSYVFTLSKDRVKKIVDVIENSWGDTEHDEELLKLVYEEKWEDGKTIAKSGKIPKLEYEGYWYAKTAKGRGKTIEKNKDLTLAIIDVINCKIYYFVRKV